MSDEIELGLDGAVEGTGEVVAEEPAKPVIPAGFKQCNSCGEVKPLSEFYLVTKASGIPRGQCKNCYDLRYYGRAHGQRRVKVEVAPTLDENGNPVGEVVTETVAKPVKAKRAPKIRSGQNAIQAQMVAEAQALAAQALAVAGEMDADIVIE